MFEEQNQHFSILILPQARVTTIYCRTRRIKEFIIQAKKIAMNLLVITRKDLINKLEEEAPRLNAIRLEFIGIKKDEKSRVLVK